MSRAEADLAAAEAWVRRCMERGETFLNLAEGQFPALERLPGIVAEWRSLEHVWAEFTALADLGPLAGLPDLGAVEILACPVADLSPLAGARLEMLDLTDTLVTDLSPLAGMDSLTELSLSGLTVGDPELKVLGGLPRIEVLDLAGTGITDLSVLAGMSGLRTLSLRHCPVADLSSLSALTGLAALDLTGTAVTDLRPVRTLTRLAEAPEGSGLVLTGCAAVAADPALARIAGIGEAAQRAQALFDHIDEGAGG